MTKILIIGWRARDEYLLSLLKDELPKDEKIPALFVSSSPEGGEEIAQKMKPIKQLDVNALPCDGFSDFINKRGCEKYL